MPHTPDSFTPRERSVADTNAASCDDVSALNDRRSSSDGLRDLSGERSPDFTSAARRRLHIEAPVRLQLTRQSATSQATRRASSWRPPPLREAPFWLPACTLVAALVMGSLLPVSLTMLLSTLVPPLTFVLLLFGDRSGQIAALLFLAPMSLGLWKGAAPIDRMPVAESWQGVHRFVGRVSGVPRVFKSAGSADRFETRFQMQGQRIGSTGAISLEVRCRGWINIARGDVLSSWLRAPVGGRVWVADATLLEVESRSTSLLGLLDRWRNSIRRRWSRQLSPSLFPWCAALILGDRGFLGARTQQRFRNLGQSHLLAISGLHVALVVRFLALALGRFALSSVAVTWIFFFCSTLFVGLTGADPPAFRAWIFATIGLCASFRGHSLRLGHVLAVSCIVLVALHPEPLRSASIVFSLSAVLGISAVLRRPLEVEGFDPTPNDLLSAATGNTQRRLWQVCVQLLRVPCGAWLGVSIPLLWWSFDRVLWGPLIALLLTPVIAVLMALGGIALLPNALLCSGVNCVGDVVCEVLIVICEQLERLPGTPGCWPPMHPIGLAALLVSALILLGWQRLTPWGWVSVILAILSFLRPLPPPGIDVLALGRGQSVLVCGSQATCVFDVGSLDRKSGGAIELAQALRRRGRDRIDLLVLSHAHADHVNGLPELLHRCEVSAVAVGPRFADTTLGRGTLELLRRHNIPVHTWVYGDRAELSEWSLTTLHPSAHPLPQRDSTSSRALNDDSLVVVLEGLGLRLLVPGDLQELGLASMALPSKAVDGIVLPHHGRPAVGLENWLRQCAPKWLLASQATALHPSVRKALGTCPMHGTFAAQHSPGVNARERSVRLVYVDSVWRCEGCQRGVGETVRNP